MHNIRLRENAVAQLEAFGNATFALDYPSLSLCVYNVAALPCLTSRMQQKRGDITMSAASPPRQKWRRSRRRTSTRRVISGGATRPMNGCFLDGGKNAGGRGIFASNLTSCAPVFVPYLQYSRKRVFQRAVWVDTWTGDRMTGGWGITIS